MSSTSATASAVALLLQAGDPSPAPKIQMLGLAPNVLVSVHEDECRACHEYARHVSSEFLGTRGTAPIPIGTVEKALEKAFPEIEERHRRSLKEAVKPLETRLSIAQSELKDKEKLYRELLEDFNDLKKDFRKAVDAEEMSREARDHFEICAAEARKHYEQLRRFLREAYPRLVIPPDAYEESEVRVRPGKRARKEHNTASEEDQSPPQEPQGKRVCLEKEVPPPKTTATVVNAVAGSSRAPVNYGDATIPAGDDSHGVYDPYLAESEDEFVEATPGTNAYSARREILHKDLEEKDRWILTANGTEKEFQFLLNKAYKATRIASKKGSIADLPPSQEAAMWRKRSLQMEKAEPSRTVFSLPSGWEKTYPEQVKALVREWLANPQAIHKWVRQDEEGTLDAIDLDITAWVRLMRPADKNQYREFRDSLMKLFEQWETIAPTINWDKIPTHQSDWLSERSSTRCPWTPAMTAEELLRWTAQTYRLTAAECQDFIVPYFDRCREGSWYNQAGKQASQPTPKRGKQKGKLSFPTPLRLAGPTRTNAELRLRSLRLNNLSIEDDTSSLVARMNIVAMDEHANVLAPGDVPVTSSKAGTASLSQRVSSSRAPATRPDLVQGSNTPLLDRLSPAGPVPTAGRHTSHNMDVDAPADADYANLTYGDDSPGLYE